MSSQKETNQAAAKAEPTREEDVDLFGEDEDDSALKEQMASKQKEAKAKKVVIAKSSVTLEAMPYDGENDITGMYETHIKKIELDGLTWGPSSQVIDGPYGLKKLAFGCAIEDAKINLDQIEEAIETLCMKPEDAEKYIELRRTGGLEDYDDEWESKPIGTVKVTSFQKI